MADPNIERQQSVLNLLRRFTGTEPIKQLFWSELSYDRENRPLSRRNWNVATADSLADDPLLLASGAGDFHIIYSRLASDKLLMGNERPVVTKLLQDHPYGLFVFSNSKRDQFHFLNVKYDDEVQKRRVFRRITVGPNEQLRTASERITLLDLAGIIPTPLAVQKQHDYAFDVEPVTREFFRQYHEVFDQVEEAITGFGRDKDRRHLFTQRLFNRLMFIAFIQKKGWLKINGDADYLAALWRAHQKDTGVSDKNFFRDRLKALFFFGLSSPNETNQIGINRGAFLKTLIGEVPYLNGGLFEEDEDDKNQEIKVPDQATSWIINNLFAHFNFTVTESTPLDVEVAVDPEMLGKIFEELVTGRHETGSYYTPKPVVSFMCREALKGCLETQVAGESKDAIEQFVELHNPDRLRDAEKVLDALRRIKVCDPACGSGAYLLGMLHELLELRQALFQSKKLDAKSVYDRKLEMIQTNIYGVDIDPFAVNIARLRLWLSLAVDFEGTKPEPLPNLDYKVEVGDSLLGPNPSGGLEMGFRKQLIDEFLKAKAQFLTSHHGEKRALKERVQRAKDDIASFAGHEGLGGFDWTVDFAEVFLSGGFDVVLANPPYVRHELITRLKPELERVFPNVYNGLADLYVYFYARAVELLATNGMLCYISSDKWLRSGYGSRLRSFMAENLALLNVIDFGDLPVFSTATTYVMITVAKKHLTRSQTLCFTKIRSLSPPYPDIRSLMKTSGLFLPPASIAGSKWNLEASEVRHGGASLIPLGELAADKMFYGIKTGLNNAFVIDSETRLELIRRDAGSREVMLPFATGRDIQKWHLKEPDKWLLYMPWDVKIKRYPAVRKHLEQWEQELSQRPEVREHRYNWWCLARYNPASYALMKKPKIVYQVFQVKPCFALDTTGAAINNATYLIASEELYLLGVLNSEMFWQEITRVCSPIQNGYQLMKDYLVKALVPVPSKEQRRTLEAIVNKLLGAKDAARDRLENDLNSYLSSF